MVELLWLRQRLLRWCRSRCVVMLQGYGLGADLAFRYRALVRCSGSIR